MRIKVCQGYARFSDCDQIGWFVFDNSIQPLRADNEIGFAQSLMRQRCHCAGGPGGPTFAGDELHNLAYFGDCSGRDGEHGEIR